MLGALDRPGSLVILPHDNPDPDALASAAALKYMFAALARKEAQIALGGIVGRAENRAMLTYLNITLVPVGEMAFDGKTAVVLVDTQPGRINNSLPEGIVPADVVSAGVVPEDVVPAGVVPDAVVPARGALPVWVAADSERSERPSSQTSGW